MKTTMRKILCLMLCFGFLMGLCSCTVEEIEPEYQPAEVEEQTVPSGIVAQNGQYSLQWDAERVALLLHDDQGVVWSSLPLPQYDDPQEGGLKMYLESHLVVEYHNAKTNSLETAYSQDEANERGRVFSEAIEDGIRITYCFDPCYLAIPVEYRLKNGYVDVSVNTADVYEDGSKIYRIALMPYAVSAVNHADNQLFIPDGCGMVMSCDTDRAERTYNAKVYGPDYTAASKYLFSNTQSVRLPVFGALNSVDKSVCCIIDKGEGSAQLYASAGHADIGWSNAYASFYFRGAETVWLTQKWGTISPSEQYSDRITSGTFGMRIYPLQESATCADIADVYRTYLIEEKGLKEETNDSLLYLDMLMAAAKREFFFGYPVDVTQAITTYAQANTILTDIAETTSFAPVVRLSGVQSGGLEIGKLAGGFRLESKLGSQTELEQLLKNHTVYPDFDLVRFRKSSSGYSKSSAAAVTASSLNALQHFIDLSTRTSNENAYRYLLVSPTKLQSAADTLLSQMGKQGITTFSLSTAGKMNYSDYRYESSYAARQCVTEITAINQKFQEAGNSLMYDAANAYAAIGATYVLNTPSDTSNYLCEDDWVPFYQMVFKGYVSMSTPSVNLSNNSQSQLLYAAQTGIGVLFTVMGNDVTAEFGSSPFTDLSAGSYETVKLTIVETIDKIKAVHSATQDASLIGFSKIEENVYRSDFDNGISVVANYGKDDVTYQGQELLGGTFLYGSFEQEGGAE